MHNFRFASVSLASVGWPGTLENLNMTESVGDELTAERLDRLLDGLTRMTEAIRSDEALKGMLLSLAKKSPEERRGIIALMSERMLAERNDPVLVETFRFLADPRVFEPALLAVTSQ